LLTLVLVGSLLVNWTVGLRLQRSWVRPIFALGLIANLAALADEAELRDVMGYMVLILLYLGLIFGSAILIWGHIAG